MAVRAIKLTGGSISGSLATVTVTIDGVSANVVLPTNKFLFQALVVVYNDALALRDQGLTYAQIATQFAGVTYRVDDGT